MEYWPRKMSEATLRHSRCLSLEVAQTRAAAIMSMSTAKVRRTRNSAEGGGIATALPGVASLIAPRIGSVETPRFDSDGGIACISFCEYM